MNFSIMTLILMEITVESHIEIRHTPNKCHDVCAFRVRPCYIQRMVESSF
ncbi:hypothetical protein ALT1644_60046 [Alteromonas macleodii]